MREEFWDAQFGIASMDRYAFEACVCVCVVYASRWERLCLYMELCAWMCSCMNVYLNYIYFYAIDFVPPDPGYDTMSLLIFSHS